MKKIFIVVVLVLLAVPAFALEYPVVKGNFVVTLPAFSYAKGMGDFSNSSNFSFLAMGFEPEVQYFVMDRLAVGGIVGYREDKDLGVTTKTTSLGPLANYYFIIPDVIVMPYAGVGLLYEEQKIAGDKLTTTSIKFQGGAVYMLGKNLSAYGEVFFSFGEEKHGTSASGQKIGLAAGVKAFF